MDQAPLFAERMIGAESAARLALARPSRTDSVMAIFLVFLGAFYPILLNTMFGVRSIDPRLFEAASMLGCSGAGMFRQIVLPASLPATTFITMCASASSPALAIRLARVSVASPD